MLVGPALALQILTDSISKQSIIPEKAEVTSAKTGSNTNTIIKINLTT